MSRLLDNLLDIKHRIKNYVEPIQEQVATWADEIDPASKSISEISVVKQPPRINKSLCARAQSTDEVCGLCEKLCPVNAISFKGSNPEISNDCMSCGICAAVCPSEALTSYMHSWSDVFDRIGHSSALYNKAYITCEKSQITLKADNIYVVPCLADITRAEWAFIMNAYSNVELYIPENLCESCTVTTGSTLYRAQIREAEKSGMYTLGLTQHSEEIDTRLKPHIEREELAVSVSNNHLEAVQRTNALNKINVQKRAFKDIESVVMNTYGNVNAQGHPRRLVNWKKFDALSSLLNPQAQEHVPVKYPVVRPEHCTGCGRCAMSCPLGACDVDRRGIFQVHETLCVGCGACVGVCEESALAIISKHF